ncbi:MAG: serine hydrolase [Minisyncoccia bacterium]
MTENNDKNDIVKLIEDFSKISKILEEIPDVSERNKILGILENNSEPVFNKQKLQSSWSFSNFFSILFLLICLVVLISGVYFFDTYIPTKKAERQKALELKIRLPEYLVWKKVETPVSWTERDSHTIFTFHNKIFLTGGLNANNALESNGQPNYDLAEYFNDIWVSDDAINWTLVKEHAEFPPVRSVSVIEFKNKLFMYGGYTPKNTYHNGIWTSEDGITWRQVTQNVSWSEREGQKIIEFQDKLWLIGGVNYYGGKTYNDIWVSDDGLVWKQVAKNSPWHPRWDFDAIVWNNELWLMGGMDRGLIGFSDIWKTSDGINWTAMGDMPIGKKQGLGLAVLDNVLYISGGLDAKTNEGYLDTWYTTDGKNWQKSLAKNKFLSREDHEVIVWNNRIWFFGGMNSSWRWDNDIWYSDFEVPVATTSVKHIITTEEIEKANISSKNLISLKIKPGGETEEIAGLNIDEVRPIASLTKLMTGLIVHKNKNVNDQIKIAATEYNKFSKPSSLGLNKTYTIEELVKTLLINSNNNAAIALMDSFEKNEFIDLMNKMSAELGMTSTVYQNPTGLDQSKQMNYSTAYDLSLLAKYLLGEHRDLLGITTNENSNFCSVTGDDCILIESTNLLLKDDEIKPIIIGGKTGDTDLAKKNLILITKTNKNNEYLINVILGSLDHFSDMKKLLTLLKNGNN